MDKAKELEQEVDQARAEYDAALIAFNSAPRYKDMAQKRVNETKQLLLDARRAFYEVTGRYHK